MNQETRHRCCYAISITMALCLCAPALGQGLVRLEIIASDDVPASIQHEWAKSLTGRFSSVRIRSLGSALSPARPAQLPAPTLERTPSGALEITGALVPSGELLLPGLRVGRGNVAAVDNWLEQLTAPVAAQPIERQAFGMSAEQLVAAHNKLSTPIEFSTAGQPAREAVKQIRDMIPMQFSVAASKALQDRFPLIEEMQGMSCGTALAAALRPLGLVFIPRRVAGRTQFVVVSSSEADEFWPIGWPLEEKADKVAPELFEFAPVNIADARLLMALEAIGARTKTPFLFDHNGLARAEIDVETVRVSHPSKKTFFEKALARLFADAKLKGELRVDERGKPFYWVSPR